MVRLATTSLTGLVALLQLANAAPQRNIGASDSETCIAGSYMYRSGRTYNQYNANYVVRCAKDSGGDTQSVQKVSRGGFATCFDICERTKDCAGFTYSGGKEAGNCYLKSKIGSYSSSSDDLVSCHKDPKGKGEKPEPVPGSSTTWQAPAPTTSTSTQSKPAPPPSSSSTSQAPALTSSTSTKPSVTSTSTASPTPSGITQCQEAVEKYGAVYRGGSGSAYQLSCGVDHYGGDLSNDGSASFLGCVDVCDKNPSCIGYAYTPGTCYLKNYLKDSEVNPNVDFALNIERAANIKPSVTVSSSSAPPSSASSSAAPTGTPAAQPGSCAYLAANGTSTYYNAVGTRYTIECAIDHNGGDLISLPANTFADCSVFCDKTNLCIAYAWTGGNGPGRCYLKSQITGRSVVSDVDYAYKDASTYFPSLSSSASASSSSTKSEPVKTSSTSTSTSTSSSAPPPPPPTWTYRPTWTESKTSSSTSSSVPPPPPPTSSSKSSSSVTPTTLTLTHTYTRPTYWETTKSHKTKTKTHHTKSSRDAPPSSTSTTLATTTKADTWTYDPWQSRLSQTKTRTVNTSKTKKTKKKKTKTKEPKETMDTKLYPVSYSFPTTTGSSAFVSHKMYTYTPMTSSKTYTPVTSSSSSAAPVTTSRPHTQTYWVSTTWTASTTSTSSAWKDDKPPHGPKDDREWHDRHDEHDRHDDHDRHDRDGKHDRHDKDDKHDRHHKDDKDRKDRKDRKDHKDRKDRDDHKPAKRDNIFKHLSKSHKPAPTKTRQNPVRTTKIPFGEQKFIDTYEFCDKIRGSKPKYLQAKVIEGNPKFDGFWLEDPYGK